MTAPRVAVVFGTAPGVGGLGVQVANAIRSLASGEARVHAIGPAPCPAVSHELGGRVEWHPLAAPEPRVIGARWRTGAEQQATDTEYGRAAVRQAASVDPSLCYVFTQVGLETLEWARARGVPTVLESPNGHIRRFRQVYADEARRWCHGFYAGHPTPAMVRRVEREYDLADRIRVSSRWSRDSMIAGGIASARISVLQQAVDLDRYRPSGSWPPQTGPLRACFVGSLDLRKGFVYLLEALRRVGPGRIALRIVGATGDWCSRRLFERAAEGLDVRCAPGDPIPVLQDTELFVFPTLEDGSPFAVAEAMACALPVVTTDANGSAEWVRPGGSGWVVAPRDPGGLGRALEEALAQRAALRTMGHAARADTVLRAGRARLQEVYGWALAPCAAA